jgi:hypothetical protein
VRSSQISDDPLLIYSLELLAAAAAEDGDGRRAATLLGATDAARERMELDRDDDEAFVHDWIQARIPRSLSPDDITSASEAGGRMDLDAALTEATAD